MEPTADQQAPRALFISRAGADADFAAVIGGILKSAGYAVILQQWDFANRNFMERMHAALAQGARVVALLSPEYLRSDHCQAEWQNAIASDPLNTLGRLIVLRVAECQPVGLLSGLAYWDLVPIVDNPRLLEEVVRDAVRQDSRDAAPRAPYWRAPPTILDSEAIRPVPSFSGREAELSEISGALAGDNGTAVVHGLGGVGKTSIVREYAWRNREQYAVIWWLAAQSEDGIVDALLRLGVMFVRGLDRLADRRAGAQQVVGSMLSGFSKPVLLIFDNLDDERLLRSWKPRAGVRALVTSRNAVWSPDITTIALHAWSLRTAINYLQRESRRADLTELDARTIAETLGALPLAVAHAAASLRSMRMVTPPRYIECIGSHLKEAPRSAEYPTSVFATFSAAIIQAEREAPGAAGALCFAASYAPDAIPDELFRQPIDRYAGTLKPALLESQALELRAALEDELQLDRALGALDRLSLLAFSEISRSYAIHRLVQLAARDLVGDARTAWTECAVAVADAAFPEVTFATWPKCERLLPHARAALDQLPENVITVPAGRLARLCAAYLERRGEYAASEPLQRRALALLEAALAPDDPEVASSLRDLAAVCYQQGRYGEAEALLRRAIAIREKALSVDHPDVATIASDLATVCQRRGRHAEAESLHKRAVGIQEAALGPDHVDVATSLNNLGVFYDAQGRFDESAPLLARALAIRERALGPDHPDIATSLNNLGTPYYRQERYEEVRPLLMRALTITENALGRDHPDVAHTLNNLALVNCRLGRYEEAHALNARALRIRERMLGPDHPDVAVSLNTFAQIYEAQRNLKEAESLNGRVLEIREKAYGPDHPLLASALEDLARLYEAQGRLDEARPLLDRATSIRKRALDAEGA